MRYILVVLMAFMSMLAGCATSSNYGNYTSNNPESFDQGLASEAAKQLANIYPPGRTQFDFEQPANDQFGRHFVDALRQSGFAVMEFDTANPTAHRQIIVNAQKEKIPHRIPNVSLQYLLDRAGTMNFYRLSLLVGGQTLSRPYAIAQDGSATPVGIWTKREF